MTGRVLLFGGCYSNLQATRALLAQAQALGIPPTRMICTGDIIAYGADAAATLRLIRDAGVRCIAGNCEAQLAAGEKNCGCGFASESACEELAALWYAHAAGQIDQDDRNFMAGLPAVLDFDLGGSTFRVLHGNADRTNAFVFPSASDLELSRQIAKTGRDAVIAGHCGVPFTRRVGGKIWHNAGSIGLPANDGTPRGWYSLLDVHDGEISFETLALDYDFAAAAAAMRGAGLPEGYAAALESGIWPSFDSLPAADRHFAGVAMELRDAPEAVPAMPLRALETLWVNTGTLCNLACENCFMESTPSNDTLSYFQLAALHRLLDDMPETLREIGFTGGEPFMNPQIMPMLELALARGLDVLVLTNAMRPMQRHAAALARLFAAYPGRVAIRVSLDHYEAAPHEALRGAASFPPSLAGLAFLARAGARISVASRTPWGESEAMMREGFSRLFAARGLAAEVVLFPEMDVFSPFAPVTAAALAAAPAVMCGSSRMVVQRKGEVLPGFVPCTLLPDRAMADWADPVALDHPHCARFCVYGGASCAGSPTR